MRKYLTRLINALLNRHTIQEDEANFARISGFTFNQIGLLAAFYDATTGKDPTTITEKDV